eukprot:c19492_g1_i1.p1 GENE.c19492_g1_i1~~c19492_g1_i1.p1  ORF type:complete len:276 (+),score=32.70 c19492_g1_i1:64-891(+)
MTTEQEVLLSSWTNTNTFTAEQQGSNTFTAEQLEEGITPSTFTAEQAESNTFTALFSSFPLTPEIRSHVKDVYLCLFLTIISAVCGVFLHILTGIGGWETFVASIVAILVVNTQFVSTNLRFVVLMMFGALQGITIGPLVALGLYVNPGVVISAFVGTATIFLCFSLSAMYDTTKRSYLYLGGFLSSALSLLCIFSLISFLFGTQLFFMIRIYLGLIVFCGYVLFDTQFMIFQASRKEGDVLKHAAHLFMDFVNIFIRILIILNPPEDRANRKNK